jgi:DNA-binding FadR family transcriptional regulator
LPSERQLSDLLGVNRGAVREAVKRLQQAGLVEVRHGGTTTVLDYLDNGGLELLPHLIFSPEGVVRVEVARSIVNMRQTMAPDIAKSCAKKRKAKHLETLESLLQQMKETDKVEELQNLAFAYWKEMVTGSGNIAYRLAFNSMQKAYEKIWSLLANVLQTEVEDLDNLSKLTQAIADQNPEDAKHYATQYVLNGTNAMNKVLDTYANQEIAS